MDSGKLDFRRDILPRLDVQAVYGSHEWTQQQPRRWGWCSRLCPECGEGSSSPGRFSCDPESMGWKCHACGLSGDPVKWLEATEGLSFSDAVKRLASIAGVSVNCSGAVRTAQPAAARPVRVQTNKHADAHKQALALWAASSPAAGTPAALYLAWRYAWPVCLDGWRSRHACSGSRRALCGASCTAGRCPADRCTLPRAS